MYVGWWRISALIYSRKAMGDYFSKQSQDYSRYRPDYPASLYQQLLPLVAGRQCAWDCGTGNGQVARVLASTFATVEATDLSAAQIANASGPSNVCFRVATAEQSGLAAKSVDLITVAQAIHWFNFDAFWQECQRVAKPGAVLAFWTYGLASAGLPNDFERTYHSEKVGAYWPPGREHVDCLYESIKPPFPCLLDTQLPLSLEWDLAHFLGYLSSWSATQNYRDQHHADPVQEVSDELASLWGEGTRQITWPLALKVYRLGECG